MTRAPGARRKRLVLVALVPVERGIAGEFEPADGYLPGALLR